MALARLRGGPLDGSTLNIPVAYDSIQLMNFCESLQKYQIEFYELSEFDHPLKDSSVAIYDYDGFLMSEKVPIEKD